MSRYVPSALSTSNQSHRSGARAGLRQRPARPMTIPEDTFGRTHRGRRADLGTVRFRSSWEANYARYLTLLQCRRLITSWEYEPDTFVFPGMHFGPQAYVPDFKVMGVDGTTVYHEVKGWLDPESRCKLKRMRRFYPDVAVLVIGPKEYKAVSQRAGAIEGWE